MEPMIGYIKDLDVYKRQNVKIKVSTDTLQNVGIVLEQLQELEEKYPVFNFDTKIKVTYQERRKPKKSCEENENKPIFT